MTAANTSTNAVSVSGMAHIKATRVSPPPGWALLERELISLMEAAVDLAARKYSRPDGTPYSVNIASMTWMIHTKLIPTKGCSMP